MLLTNLYKNMTITITWANLQTASLSCKKTLPIISGKTAMPGFLLKILLIFSLCIGPLIVKGQLSASFTIDPTDTAGCAPMIVHFTNTSTGATSYSWNLGNGSPLSTYTDVSGTYTTAGTYTITLTAYNGSSSSTYSATIRVYALPTVNFSASDTAVCPGIPITFTSSSTTGSWGSLSYYWVFGDGGHSSLVSPTYSYPAYGYYSVTLIATNSKGCVGSLTKSVHVLTPAFVGFTASGTYFCRLPATCSFTSTTIGTAPLSYSWRFGDGYVSTAPSPSHTYTATGNYTIALKVTDGKGCVDSLVYPSYITVNNLSAAFTAPSTSCINSPDTFHNASSAHVSSLWYFGDGGTSTADTPVYAYTTSGTYTVKLIIFDGTCYDTAIHTIVISHPTGSFNVTPTEPCTPPSPLMLTALVPSGCTVSWYSYIDGFLGTGATLSHTFPVINYAPPGDPTPIPLGRIDSIYMVITNTLGCKDTVGKVDTINYLIVGLGLTGPLEGCTPLNVHFYASPSSQVYDIFAGAPWYRFGTPGPPYYLPNYLTTYTYPYSVGSYSWNFGDGSPISTAATPIHTYTLVGASYSYSCTITTSNSCSASAVSGTSAIAVGAPPPTPSFTITPTHSCAGSPVHFNSTATGVFNHYAWDFGDGNSDTTADPVHVFTVPGTFTVDLVTMYNECPSIHFDLTEYVDSPSAVINYHYDCIPKKEIAFGDSSLGDNTHLWQFGDGTTSTAPDPIHDYPAVITDTVDTVTLTTYNAATGCRDTSHTVINLKGLKAVLTPIFTSICKDFVDSIHVHVLDTPGLSSFWTTKYSWYAGGVLFDTVSSSDYNDTGFYAFHTAGNIPVTLVLTDNHGCLDTFTTNILVTHPTDSFSYTLSSTCAPVPVLFTDHSSDVPGAAITSYYWSFGDGGALSTTSGAPVTHTYLAGGTFNVEEIVTDNLGCKDTLISSSHPVVHQPGASFSSYSTTVCAGAGAHFINTSTGAVSSLWFFGDGDTSSATTPIHVYTIAGVYTVKLVVTGAFGCTDTATSAGYITVNPKPAASFYMTDSFAVCPPLNVNCINTTTGATTYYWTFGGLTSSSSVSPSGVFVTPGNYAIKLYATNSFGCTDSAIHHASLFGYSGAFSYSPVSGCAPFRVHFSASLSSVTGIIWDFNDGVTTTLSLADTTSHVYLYPGTYIPKLVLTDTTGCTSFSLGLDTIKVDTLIPGFTFSPNPVCQGNTITFADSSTSYFSSSASWLWTFATGATSTLAAPTYSYSVNGVRSINLTVTDGMGCSGSLVKNVTVNPAPTAISGSSGICPGSTIALTDTIPGGVWSTGSVIVSVNPVSGAVLGMSTGTAIITYSLGLGCIATKTITVNTISPILGATGICVGATTALTDPGGGTWNSSNAGVATVGTTSGIVTGMMPGNTTITYLLSPGCSTIRVITVNTTPSAIGGPASVCLHGTINLSDTAGGGIWSIVPISVAAIGSTGTVTGSSLGTAVVTYSLGSGCIKHDTITVTPLPAAITGINHVCPGTATTLADTTTGGLWSGSNALAAVGSMTGIVTGITAGTATITYTEGGCITTAPVTINPLPKMITGPDNVCHGSTITLSDSSTGGTWSSSAASAPIGSGTGIITGISPGPATITYTLPTGCIKATTVNVYSSPAAISGALRVCIGTTIPLSDSTAGGIWSSSSSSIASAGSVSGIVTGGLASGVATITYSLGGSCYSTVSVTVDSLPSPITGTAVVCLGSSAPLTDLPSGGAWSSSNPLMLSVGAATGIITGAAVGTATITYSLGPGCTTHTAPITVNPLPPAIVGPAVICAGYSTLLHDPGSGAVWSSSNMAAATIGTTGLVSGTASGGATIISYTIASGCAATLAMDVVAVPPIDGITPLCAYGNTIRLYDSIPGGAWTASLVTITDSGIVSIYAAGLATIYYTLSSGCYTSATLTVNPLPDPITGSLRLCTGQTTTLGDLTPGGMWSSGTPSVATAGSGSGLITAELPGASAITYTIPATGCMQSVMVTVSAFPSPVGGSAQVCVGAATTLTDTTSGGIWSSGAAGMLAIGSTTGVATGIASGTSMVTYTLAPSCLVTRAITVNPLPALYPVSGGGNYCSGDTGVHIVLAGSNTGTSYQLYHGSASTGSPVAGTGATLDFGLVTSAGVYYIMATTTVTSCSATMPDSAIVTITPSIIPSVSLSSALGDTICAGSPATFTAIADSGGAAPAYQWKVNSVNSGTDSAAYTYTPLNGDIVSVLLTSDATCARPDTVSRNIIMTVDPLLIPVVTINAHPGMIIFTGQSDTFTATATGGGADLTYQWENGGGIIPGATSQTYIDDNPSNGDSISCVVTSVGFCGGQSGANGGTVTVINNVGVATPILSRGTITVLPNPNKGEFTIQGPLGNKIDEEVTLEIKDLLGQVVYKAKVMAYNGVINEHLVLSDRLANGTYILILHAAAENKAFHIVVEQ